jgi:hypothetical protein
MFSKQRDARKQNVLQATDGREMRNGDRWVAWRMRFSGYGHPIHMPYDIFFAQFTCISEDSWPNLSEIRLKMSSSALMYRTPATWSRIRPSRYRDRYNCHELGYSSHMNEVDPIQNEANIY